MDPQQEFFSALLVALRDKYGTNVYDGFLPPEGTDYPFIYMADSQQVDDAGNKMQVLGDVYQTIHVYSNTPRSRGSISAILRDIKQTAYAITRTPSYQWEMVGVNQQILPDNTTASPLLHGILELQLRLLGGIK